MAASWLTEGSGHSSDATASPRFSAQRTTSSSLDEDAISPVSSVPPSPVHQPERGRTLHRSAIRTFDPTLAPICGSPSSQGAFLPSYQSLNENHVSFSRDPEQIPAPFPPHHHPHPAEQQAETAVAAPAPPPPRLRTTSSQSRPPVSRRSTSSPIIFLSVGALMTLGSVGSSAGAAGGAPLARRSGEQGRVWAAARPTLARRERVPWTSQFGLRPRAMPVVERSPVNAAPSDVERSNVFPLDVPEQANDPLSSSTPLPSSSSDRIEFDVSGTRTSGSEEPPHQPHGPDWERIIGRTSAWTCTTAYLTSRLPQIWQNVRSLLSLRFSNVADSVRLDHSFDAARSKVSP